MRTNQTMQINGEQFNVEVIYCDDCGDLIAVFIPDTDEYFKAELDCDGNVTLSDSCPHTYADGADVYQYGDKEFCSNCEDEWEECAECGAVVRRDEMTYASDTEELYCDECTRDYLHYCDHCENWFRDSDSFQEVNTRHGTEYWCELCVEDDTFYCTDCEEYYDDSYFTCTYIDGYGDVCEDCLDNGLDAGRYGRCDECGDYYEIDDLESCTDGDYDTYWYCRSCLHRNRPPEPQVIYGYHAYPAPEFLDTSTIDVRRKVLHVGVELEIADGGTNGNNALAITQAMGHKCDESREIRCSRDGSVPNGFELISQPRPVQWLLDNVDYKAGMATAQRLGYHSHDGGCCGLHIHVDREFFEDAMVDVEDAMSILTINNMDWLKAFSRRQNWNYCHFPNGTPEKFEVENFKDTEANENATERIKNFKRFYRGHGSAMNYENASTVEFRFFRGTLKYSTFVASLQLVEMMCYAARHFRKEQLATVNLAWFKRFAKRLKFTEFSNYLEERAIMA